MRALVVLGVIVLVYLQGRLWFSDVGYFERGTLEARVAELRERNHELEARNLVLAAEVRALKSGFEAVEARARSELGMIKEGETFYMVVNPK